MNKELYDKVLYNISTKVLSMDTCELEKYLTDLQAFLGLDRGEFEVCLCHAINVATINATRSQIEKNANISRELTCFKISALVSQKVSSAFYKEDAKRKVK